MHNEIALMCIKSREQLIAGMEWSIQTPHGLYLAGKRASAPAKVLAIAHIDYVRSGRVHYCGPDKIVSSALDDRLGVWLALNIERLTGIPLDVILTDGEESGQSTARYINIDTLDRYNWIVEFDRRGLLPVTYGYYAMDEPLISVLGNIAHGTYSDICELEDTSPIAAYNHGVGYRNEHTEKCAVTIADVEASIDNFVRIYDALSGTKIEHEPLFDTFEDRLISWSDPWEDAPESEGWYNENARHYD